MNALQFIGLILYRYQVNGINIAFLMTIEDIFIEDVKPTQMMLMSFYDSQENAIILHHSLYGSTDTLILSIAGHEAGHAVQHNKFKFLRKINRILKPIFRRRYLVVVLAIMTFLQVLTVSVSKDNYDFYFVTWVFRVLVVAYFWMWFLEINASYISLKAMYPYYGLWHRGLPMLLYAFWTYVRLTGLLLLFLLYKRIQWGII